MPKFHAMLQFNQFTPGNASCYLPIEAQGPHEAAEIARAHAEALRREERPDAVYIYDDRGLSPLQFTVSK